MYLIGVSAVFKLADDVEQLFHFLLLELLNGALVAGGDFAADGEVGTESKIAKHQWGDKM